MRNCDFDFKSNISVKKLFVMYLNGVQGCFVLSVLYQIALETRDYLYKIILTNFVLNECSTHALS